MIKPFHQTQISQVYGEFDSRMRDPVSLIMVYLIIQHFQYRNILEMGFYQGLTLATMLEAAPPGAKLTTIDIEFRRDVFDKHYAMQQHPVTWIQASTEDFCPTEVYDFINVDGSPQRDRELDIASQCIANHGVIMFDDYRKWEAGISQFLQRNTGWVPFLADSKALYFHQESHDAGEFLDYVVENRFCDFCHTGNRMYQGHLIKTVEPRPIDIVYMPDIFPLFAQKRNI